MGDDSLIMPDENDLDEDQIDDPEFEDDSANQEFADEMGEIAADDLEEEETQKNK